MTRARSVVAAWLGIAAVFSAVARPTRAQSEGDFAAFAALILTPIGALPPVVRAPMMQGGPLGSGLHVRYGHYEFDGSEPAIHNIGVGGDFEAGTGRTGVTVGFQTCDGCDGTLMLGFDYTAPLLQRVIGATATPSNTSTLGVAVSPSLGVARTLGSDANTTLFSVSVGLPVSLAARLAEHAQLVPFITPGFGFGMASGNGQTDSGVRFVLGGGVGVANVGPGVGLTLGFQRVFIEGGPTQWGLGFTWHGPAK